MRIVCFVPKTSGDAAPRLGALLPDEGHVLDFAAAIKAGDAAPLGAWYDLDGPYLPRALAFAGNLGGDVLDGARRATPAAVVPLADIRLLAPVPRPGKLICIGLNYKDHAAESKMPLPSSPVTFSKYTTAVTHPASPVYLPAVSQQVDYEAPDAQRAGPAVCGQAVAAGEVLRQLRPDGAGHRHGGRHPGSARAAHPPAPQR